MDSVVDPRPAFGCPNGRQLGACIAMCIVNSRVGGVICRTGHPAAVPAARAVLWDQQNATFYLNLCTDLQGQMITLFRFSVRALRNAGNDAV